MPILDLLKATAKVASTAFGASATYVGYQASRRPRVNTGDDLSKYQNQKPSASPKHDGASKVATSKQQGSFRS